MLVEATLHKTTMNKSRFLHDLFPQEAAVQGRVQMKPIKTHLTRSLTQLIHQRAAERLYECHLFLIQAKRKQENAEMSRNVKNGSDSSSDTEHARLVKYIVCDEQGWMIFLFVYLL